MDPVTLAASGAGAWLAGHLFGPSAHEVGEHLAAPLKRWRERQATVLDKAGRLLQDQGVQPRHVSDAVWMPLLQNAGLADSEAMQNRWAALLAAAADPRREEMPPSFPRIMAELSPADAIVLEATYNTIRHLTPNPEMSSQGPVVSEIPKATGLSVETVTMSLENLLRLRLVAPPSTKLEFIDSKEHKFQLQNLDIIVCGTTLGAAFVAACHPRGFKSRAQPSRERHPLT